MTDISDQEITPDRYAFWMNDLTVLYRDNNYIKFFPTKTMTRVEQLNALTRFSIYLLLIFLMFDRSEEWIYIPIVIIILVIILYNIFQFDEDGKRKELIRIKNIENEQEFDRPDINYRVYSVRKDGKLDFVDTDLEQPEDIDLDGGEEMNEKDDFEVGYYDSNGKLTYGKAYSATTRNRKHKNIKYSLDEMRIYNRAKCRKPSVDNPFMNPTIDDMNKDNPTACNVDDAEVEDDIEKKFNGDIYRDVDDVFNRKNSQRQFFTVANQVPNDQEAFARFCYGFPSACKTDQEKCLRYQDLRVKSTDL